MPDTDTSGFYSVEISGSEKILLFAPNGVIHSENELHRSLYNTYVYPFDVTKKRRYPPQGPQIPLPDQDGWRWFQNETAARNFFNIPFPDPDPDPGPNF